MWWRACFAVVAAFPYLIYKKMMVFVCRLDCKGGVMYRMLTWNALDRGYKPMSCQIKDNQICILCFSTRCTIVLI